MSTNYFKPVPYQVPRVIDNAATPIPAPTLKNVDTSGISGYNEFGAITGGANYGRRQQIIDQLKQTGDTSLYQTFLKNVRAQRDAFKGQLSGYGGFSFKPDDTSTQGLEDLEISQQTGLTGAKEVEGIQSAQALAASRGISGKAQSLMIGAALQRVSEEARSIINQYSDAISGTKQGGLAYEFKKEQDRLLGEWSDLYGKDMNVALTEQMRNQAAATAAQQKSQRESAAAAEEAAKPVGKIGQYKTKALAENAVNKFKQKYPDDKYTITYGKPGGKDYFVIMVKRK